MLRRKAFVERVSDPVLQVVRVEPQAALALASGLLEAHGASPAAAEIVARHLVESDRRGVHSHGLLRVPQYTEELARGEIDGRAEPEVVERRAARVTIDGHRS